METLGAIKAAARTRIFGVLICEHDVNRILVPWKPVVDL
jgi:hypothetical protein